MGETISEAIGADHHSFDIYAEKIKNAQNDADKVKWRNQLTWTIARHAISEELTLYPAMEKHLGEIGVKLTKTDKEQHMAVKEDLNKFQDMSPSDAQFIPTLDMLLRDLHHHIQHESEEDMPQLETLLSRNESEAIARSFRRTKNIVPTRSHPAAPTEFYAENLAALLAAPIDRMRDWLRSFPDQDEMSNAEAKAEQG